MERCCGDLKWLKRASGSALPGTCLGGAEVVRRLAPPKPEDPHDQAQTQAERRAPLTHPKGSQAGAPQAIGARIVKISRAISYQARPHYCDATNIGWRNDCFSRHRN